MRQLRLGLIVAVCLAPKLIAQDAPDSGTVMEFIAAVLRANEDACRRVEIKYTQTVEMCPVLKELNDHSIATKRGVILAAPGSTKTHWVQDGPKVWVRSNRGRLDGTEVTATSSGKFVSIYRENEKAGLVSPNEDTVFFAGDPFIGILRDRYRTDFSLLLHASKKISISPSAMGDLLTTDFVTVGLDDSKGGSVIMTLSRDLKYLPSKVQFLQPDGNLNGEVRPEWVQKDGKFELAKFVVTSIFPVRGTWIQYTNIVDSFGSQIPDLESLSQSIFPSGTKVEDQATETGYQVK